MSEHFTPEDHVVSQMALRLGIDNTPDDAARERIQLTEAYMEVVRVMLGNRPITVSSWYRSPVLNKKIGGSKTSQHCKGEAVDFICPKFGTPAQIVRFLMDTGLPYDQLIFEGTWVHISFVLGTPRREVLTAVFSKKGVSYVKGLVEPDTA